MYNGVLTVDLILRNCKIYTLYFSKTNLYHLVLKIKYILFETKGPLVRNIEVFEKRTFFDIPTTEH